MINIKEVFWPCSLITQQTPTAMGHCLNCARYSETNCLRWWDTFLGWWWLTFLLFLPLDDFETDVLFGGSPGVFFSATGHRLNCARYSETNCLWWWDTFLGWWWLTFLLFLPLDDFETDILFGGSCFELDVGFLVWVKTPSFVDFPLPTSLSSPIRSASCSLGDSRGWRLTPRWCSPSTGSSASSRLSVWIWVGWQLWWRTFSALRRGDSNVGVFHVYWSWYSVGVLTSPWRKPALYLSPFSSCDNKVIASICL